VYAWGQNSAGQLGLGDRRDRHAPAVVDALWALPVVQLAAGDAHSAALTSNGHAFIWGSNHFGQLGLVRDAEGAAGRVRRS
jgi:alpha-tubulin suppressor-like RCC1 family protein